MRCGRCGSNAVVELRYLGEPLCGKHFTTLFEKRVRKTIRSNRLLRPDGRVIVALSGGKSSAVMLYILKRLSERIPESDLNAVTVDEGIRGYSIRRIKYAKKICRDWGVEHHVFSFKKEFGFTLDQVMRKTKNKPNMPPAYRLCDALRYRILNEKARELEATKVALGHNLDDEVRTSLMNYIRGDLPRIAGMGALVEFRGVRFVPRIKPLRECPREEVALYARLKGFKVDFRFCPYSQGAFREEIGDALNDIEEKHPGSRFQILRSMDELIGILREQYIKNKECVMCGDTTSSILCEACEIVEKIRADFR